MRIATIIDDTEAEGPGRRMALWVQGCTLACPGCCNPEMWRASGGTEMSVFKIIDRIDSIRGIEGISLLGGEPTEQAADVASIAEYVRSIGKNVMLYSGRTLAELRMMRDHDVDRLLAATDVLVDGRYDRTQPEPRGGRRWVGSTNQTIHFLTNAYGPHHPKMAGENTVEIRVSKSGMIAVNGWPGDSDALVTEHDGTRRLRIIR